MGTIKERYLLLRHIADAEPVGRRTLAGLSGLSERVVRSHVDVLRRSGIVRFTTLGIAGAGRQTAHAGSVGMFPAPEQFG